MSSADNRIGTDEDQMDTANAKELAAEKNLKLKDRKVSWAKLRRVDSLNLEAGRVSLSAAHSSKVNLTNTIHINKIKFLVFLFI